VAVLVVLMDRLLDLLNIGQRASPFMGEVAEELISGVAAAALASPLLLRTVKIVQADDHLRWLLGRCLLAATLAVLFATSRWWASPAALLCVVGDVWIAPPATSLPERLVRALLLAATAWGAAVTMGSLDAVLVAAVTLTLAATSAGPTALGILVAGLVILFAGGVDRSVRLWALAGVGVMVLSLLLKRQHAASAHT
jgi:hypothetical protein